MLLVAPGAEASFDAPKRLAALIGVAAAAVVAWTTPRPRGDVATTARVCAGLVVAALLGAVVSAATSSRPAVAWDTLRVLFLGALCLPLGASPALDDGRWRWPLIAFLAGATIDAVVSLVQAAGAWQPFDIVAVAGRAPTGAFLGNEGQLALVLALGVIAVAGIVATAASTASRSLAAASGVVLLAALLANRNLTAILAAAAGGVVLASALVGRRAIAPLALGGAVLAGVVAVVPPLRARVVQAAGQARDGRWDDLTSNRLGAWAAALEMVRARPLTGMGPGTFGAEFVAHRLAAELRWQTRFVIPTMTSTFAETHDDYLQAAAELGAPAAIAAIAAAVLLLAALARRGGSEAAVLLALLCAGAVAALTWFPLQRPATALPLLLAAGRAWRLIA